MPASRVRTAVSVGVMFLFSIVLLSMLAAKARAKPFWHDEIYTVLVAELPSVGTMWAAALDGIDLAPPLNALATRAVRHVSDAGPVAMRVPPIVGYWLMSVILFEFVRQRSHIVSGLSAAFLPTLTAAFRFSYEARGYGIMLALFAAALFFWADAAAGRRRGVSLAIMAAAIGAGLWNQYWAVLVFVPLGIGELVRLMRSRQPDWTMWATMTAAAATTFPLWPLMRVASSQSATFWRHATFADIGETYQFLFEPLFAQRFGITAAVAVLLIAPGFAIRRRAGGTGPERMPRASTRATVGVRAHEAAAIAGCLLVPVLAVLVGVFVTGVFVPRYALPGIVGLSLGVPLVIARSGSVAGLAPIVMCGVLAWTFAESAVQTLTSPPAFRDPVAGRGLLLQQLSNGSPVVVSGSLVYLQLWYYTPEPLQSRLKYLADPQSAIRYAHSDTIDLGYQALHRWTSVGVESFDRFVADHSQFVVYAMGSGWLMDRLRDYHATFEELGREAGATVYLVRIVK